MKNLYLLPTGKESKLFENVDNGIFAFSKEAIRWRGEQFLNYHIYITSSTDKSQGYYISTEGDMCIFKPPFHPKEHHEKIILTDDPSLVGVQQIDDEFLKWFVKNPKCEWVEVEKEYKNWYVSGLLAPDMKLNYKVIIPKQQTKTNREKLPFPELVEKFVKYYKDVPLVEETYICPKTNKRCDDECCVSAENCNIGTGVLSEPKQETLEEAAKNSDKSKCKHFRREHTKIEVYDSFEEGFVAGAKWQQERDYELIDRYVDDVMGGCNLKFKEWANR